MEHGFSQMGEGGERRSLARPVPLAGLVPALRSGELDLVEHAQEVCDRIAAVEPAIHALLPEGGRRERLVAEARRLRERFPDPAARPPIFGVLIGVKDIFRTDGFPTRAGSKLPPELFDGPEAPCVTRLREAGALVVGKTVTTEFAYFEPGPTRNPWNPAHTPGGSSSGSAAGVAAGFCALALGSQTVGSVIRPASFCGIVGVKPSFGAIPVEGMVPDAPSLDHVGFFTPDLAGAALVAEIFGLPGEAGEAGGSPPVLGVPDGPYLDQAGAEGRALFEAQVERLRAHGLEVRRVPLFEDIPAINRRNRIIVAGEMAAVHRLWFAQYGELYSNKTADLIREGQAVEPEDLVRACEGRRELRERLARTMEEHGIDVWISPAATGPAPEGLGSTGDPSMNLPWTHTGMPVVTLPVGRAANGLPVGLQCAARLGRDRTLLAWALPIERALQG
jgi:Asp-tRNA(Asn)/Glu-tRNA(Gln) amidotransferase A subunit family amidase